MPPIKVLLIEDHVVVRTGLRMLLDGQPTISVVGEAGTREDALALASSEQPNIILLDPMLNTDSSLAFLPELLACAARARVIVLTGVLDPEMHRRSVSLGAMGIVLKDQPPEVLFKAIDRVHAGEIWIERSLMASVLSQLANPTTNVDPELAKIALLTPREREVIALIGEGLKNKAIAERLFITETTARNHLASIFAKLGVVDRLELALYAYRHHLVPPPR
jgi:DNA-binding NarL/FixJ family response regulator